MAYTTIDKPSDYFNTKLYTGNGTDNNSTQSINMGLQPDLCWIKNRNLSGASAQAHHIFDNVRGGNLRLMSDFSSAESDKSDRFNGITSTGFDLVQDDAGTNESPETYVAWGWKAGTSFTNDASATGIGSIDSTGSVSDASGFSIVSYTGTGSAGTIKHGLSAAPNFMIVKNRDAARSWNVYFGDPTDYMYLNDTAAAADYNEIWNDTAPTTSVFSVGTDNGVNQSGEKYIAYIFAEKKGYSKFGSYTGNGNNDGTFVYTGFKPAFVMNKLSSGADNWLISDNKRLGYNEKNQQLFPNLSNAEQTNVRYDLYSNGFKVVNNNGEINTSGATYIYMAFAENPFVTSTGVPATAR
jgi:hypothetical protein